MLFGEYYAKGRMLDIVDSFQIPVAKFHRVAIKLNEI